MVLEETRQNIVEMLVRVRQSGTIELTSEFHFAGCEHDRNARRNARRGRYDRGMAGGRGRQERTTGNARRGHGRREGTTGGMAGGMEGWRGMAGAWREGTTGGHDRRHGRRAR